jgi:hypothetical protein
MAIGIAANKQTHCPDYKNWGAFASKKFNLIDIKTADFAKLKSKFMRLGINFKNFQPVSAAEISYYQGKNQPEDDAILIRFQSPKAHQPLWGEQHISLIYRKADQQLLGFTRMIADTQGLPPVKHQTALDSAIKWLKTISPELLPQKYGATPQLTPLKTNERMAFGSGHHLSDQIQLHWIASHTEELTHNGQKQTIHGMKVKFFLLPLNLWAWVIVDANGMVQTFEKNISWNMKKIQRETQMWLHDRWLEQHIKPITPPFTRT